MGILRADEMRGGTLLLPPDSARDHVEALAREAHVEIEDMNEGAAVRPYRKKLQRLDEVERKLRFLVAEVRKHLDAAERLDGSSAEAYLRLEAAGDVAFRLEHLEEDIAGQYSVVVGVEANGRQMRREQAATVAHLHVMRHAARSLVSGQHRAAGAEDADADLEDEPLMAEQSRVVGDDRMRFSNVAGVVASKDQERLGRTLFRASRGNTFVHFEPIPEPLYDDKADESVPSAVFVVYFQGAADSVLHSKVTRIASGFDATLYEWPATSAEAARRCSELQTQVAEQERAMAAAREVAGRSVAELLEPVAEGGNPRLEDWRLFLVKERALLATLNKFEGERMLCATCWYPAKEERLIRDTLARSSREGQVRPVLMAGRGQGSAPSFIRTTAVTAPFQELVDTIGVPGYGEVNPMIFTCVSFPFLFGVMFGDIGHGLIMFIFASLVIWREPELRKDKSLAPLLYIRYMLLAMGFFAIYAGFMYNDMLSLGLELFPSRWEMHHDPTDPRVHVGKPTYNIDDPAKGPGPYPFGLDPAWHGASNELIYVNSLKMKCAVLFGVAQMVLGISLKWINSVHRRNVIDFACECLPQMVFMVAIFGYMDWMILYKWVTPMANPPSVINTLIGMALGLPLRDQLYAGQDVVQPVLMLVATCCVPLMLIPKPILLWLQHRRGRAQAASASDNESDDLVIETGHGGGPGQAHGAGGAGHGGKKGEAEAEEEFEMGEVCIHQIIETIEFVLGTVSHTASYLRLWALSLAHQQLSLVFFQKIVLAAMAVPAPWNGLAIYVAYAVFMCITVGVLMGMDVMECFLHTLRLHWVEFQDKFYGGDGRAFAPFRLDRALKPQAE